MKSISLKTDIPSNIEVVGALDFDQRSEGLGIRRLPDWTRPQVPQGLDVMLRMPSGVRLRIKTNASTIGLDAVTTTFGQAAGNQRPVAFDIQFDEQITSVFSPPTNRIVPDGTQQGAFKIERGDTQTVWFENLGEAVKTVEIWLPQNAYVSLQQIHLNGDLMDLANDQRKRWIHYGSSISHCMEASTPSQIWPGVAARLGGLNLMNFGFGGQCHLDPFVARTIAALPADLISIKVGINIINLDSMKERVFLPLLHGFLDTIREHQPSTPVCLISPIYCPSAEDRAGPTIPNAEGKFETLDGLERIRQGSMSLKRVRELLASVVESRRQSGDANIEYFNGLDLFSEAEVHLLPDHLHPNNAGYSLMGSRFHDRYLKRRFSSR